MPIFKAILIIALLGLSACGQTPAASPADSDLPAETEDTAESGLPALMLDCSVCHDLNRLAEAASDETAGAREWMSGHSPGLLRQEPGRTASAVELNQPWVSRGRHENAAAWGETCRACHPVDASGVGHGLSAYPPESAALAFRGTDCAGACHGWLQSEIVSAGFVNSLGKTITYMGRLDPAELLGGAANAHSALWKEGLAVESPALKITAFNPGCGGCHNAAGEAHGSVPACLDCHRFAGPEGELHAGHTEAISARRALNDPARLGLSPCVYCHFEEEARAALSNAACYNCHLSAHQPLDPGGAAHFWME